MATRIALLADCLILRSRPTGPAHELMHLLRIGSSPSARSNELLLSTCGRFVAALRGADNPLTEGQDLNGLARLVEH